MKIVTALVPGILLSAALFAQPANDDCPTATVLTVGASCGMQNFNSAGATATTGVPNPTCGGYLGGDVWFTAAVPLSGKIRIEIQPGTNSDPVFVIYTGTCGSLVQYICSDPETQTISDPALAGQTIYIRVYRWSNASGGTFGICLWEPPVPSNDNCADAIPLAVGSSCNPLTFTNLYSTGQPASVAPNPGCGFYSGGDVWFTAVVPISGKLRIELQPGTNGDPTFVIYTGTCGSLVQYVCDDSHSRTISDPSLGGQPIYIRVFRWANVNGGTFGICLFEPVIPSNDNCADAIPLTVGTSCNPAAFTNLYATSQPTSVAPNPGCGFYSGGDVWFTAVVPISGKLRVELQPGTNVDPTFVIYTGTCGSLVQYICDDSHLRTISDPSLGGQTVYIRVFRWANVNGGTFGICLFEPVVPSNDNCANAIPLATGSGCTMSSYTNAYATAQPVAVAANPSCGFYGGGDVWFTTTMPASGNIRIEDAGSPGMLPQIAVYSGTCGAFTQLFCMQNDDAHTYRNAALGGQTLYIRVYNYSNKEGGTFTICSWEPPVPSNDDCANAIPVTVGTACSMNQVSNAYATAQATSVAPNPTCGFYGGGDTWYTLVMPATGVLTINRSNGPGMTIQMALYSGTCGAFTQLACPGTFGALNYTNVSLAGQTLYLRFFSYSSEEGGSFSFCAYDPSCLVSISNVSTNNATCPVIANGSATVTASCANCSGTLDYSKDNGATFQSSPIFNNLNGGTVLNIKVRDHSNSSCTLSYPGNPVFIGSNTPTHIPAISISANPGNTICSGTPVTFTAIPVNGGSVPAYQWKKNGTTVGTNSSTYADNGLLNNDNISCVLTSNDPCASPLTASSNAITMSVNQVPTWYEDADADGLGDPNSTVTSCTQPAGYVQDHTDACPFANQSALAHFNTAACNCDPGYYEQTTVVNGHPVVTGCTLCPAGSYCPDGVSAYPCPAGSFSSGTGAVSCAPCAAGTFNNTTGNTFCNACPAGTYNNTTGNTFCTSCPAGTFSSTVGSTSCTACPNGTFQPNTGQASCISCAMITFSTSVTGECSGINTGQISFISVTGGTPPYAYSTDNGNSYHPNSMVSVPGNQAYQAAVKDANGCVSTSVAVFVPFHSPVTWYRDADSDGYGNAAVSQSSCTQPAGYVAVAGDCDDTNPLIHPGAQEICGNGIDDDCDGQVDEGCCAAPVLSCPANITVSTDGGSCNAMVNYPLVQVSGTPAITINYSQNSGSLFSVGTTTIHVTATNSCGSDNCSFKVTVTDNENPTIISPPDVTANSNLGGCSASGVALGTPTVNDNCGVLSVSNNAPSTFPFGSTTVTWVVTDIHGHTASASQTVTVVSAVLVTISRTNVTCNGGKNGTATASATGFSPYTYLWSNGKTTASVTGLSSGTYTVTATDAHGCTKTAAVSISQPAAVSVSVSTTSGTATATPGGGTPGYTYSWSNGQTTQTATGLIHGQPYTIIVTDSKGCKGSGFVYASRLSHMPVGTEDSKIEVFPNPSSGKITIRFNEPVQVKYELAVFDLPGKELMAIERVSLQGINLQEIDVGSPGTELEFAL